MVVPEVDAEAADLRLTLGSKAGAGVSSVRNSARKAILLTEHHVWSTHTELVRGGEDGAAYVASTALRSDAFFSAAATPVISSRRFFFVPRSTMFIRFQKLPQ